MKILELASRARRNDIEKCWEFDEPLPVEVTYFYYNYEKERVVETQEFHLKKLFLNCFFDTQKRSRPYWSVLNVKVL